jgi:hypothetical protein
MKKNCRLNKKNYSNRNRHVKIPRIKNLYSPFLCTRSQLKRGRKRTEKGRKEEKLNSE